MSENPAMDIDRSEAAKALRAIPRQRTERMCPICGKAFEGYGRQLYCGNACRQRAKYRRHWGHEFSELPPKPIDTVPTVCYK